MKRVQTVLMIDDDIDDQEIFREVLHEIDPLIICLQPSNAKIALSRLLEDNQRPDFIFLDINMPIMNGFEFLEELMMHERLNSIPVVMYTTSTHKAQQEKAKMLGASDFITKPSDLNLLKATLETVFLADHTIR
jgi:CheY-like chemotaxis protein